MRGKYTVLRSEARLKNVDPAIQKLFNQKHIKIIKAQEEEQEEAEKTQSELIEALVELASKNADDIKAIADKINVKIEADESPEEIKEKVTKSLTESGFDVGLVYKGKRLRVVG